MCWVFISPFKYEGFVMFESSQALSKGTTADPRSGLGSAGPL